jgi:hypothetical protein
VQIIFAYSIPRKQGIEGGIVQKVVKRRLLPLLFHVAKAPAIPGMLPTSRTRHLDDKTWAILCHLCGATDLRGDHSPGDLNLLAQAARDQSGWFGRLPPIGHPQQGRRPVSPEYPGRSLLQHAAIEPYENLADLEHSIDRLL